VAQGDLSKKNHRHTSGEICSEGDLNTMVDQLNAFAAR